MANRLERAISALGKRLLGPETEFTTSELTDLEWLQQLVGARRPLETYAPRTRRRYLAAAREGISAQEQYRREYQTRRRIESERDRYHGLTRRRYERMNDLLLWINDHISESQAHNWDMMEEMIESSDYETVLYYLKKQKEMIIRYMNGEYGVGSTPREWWDNRPSELAQEFFYYHARLGK